MSMDQADKPKHFANPHLKVAEALKGKAPVFATSDSIRRSEEIMAQARQEAASNLVERIRLGEFIRSEQLQTTWQVDRAAISDAEAAGGLFSVVGPSGENYYPAFYTDTALERRVLEKVAKALGPLPAAVKYHFFTSKFTALGESPLEALRKGRIEQVLAAAACFAER